MLLVNGACLSAWAIWAKRPIFNLYESMTVLDPTLRPDYLKHSRVALANLSTRIVVPLQFRCNPSLLYRIPLPLKRYKGQKNLHHCPLHQLLNHTLICLNLLFLLSLACGTCGVKLIVICTSTGATKTLLAAASLANRLRQHTNI